MRVSAQYAQTHLDDLLSAADRGEEVEIERAEKPAVRMSLIQKGTKESKGEARSLVGALKGKIWIADDFKSPAESETMADLFEGKAG